ncbi:MAG: sigma-54 interaction domain-containing protein [Longimicrobiales bacterium]
MADLAPVKPTIAVYAVSDAFSVMWAELAESVGATSVVASTLSELAPMGGACAVVVSLGGMEAGTAEALAQVRGAGAELVGVVGAAADHRLAVTALRSGAAQYFALPQDLEALRTWLQERADRWRADRDAETLAAAAAAAYDFSAQVGRSAGLRRALERAARIIPHASTTVLITGETGTGKELLAQAIHYNGPRGRHPFVEVNCSALPPTLLEAELFGYERGAFTDARAAKPGLFEAAHRGTILLDEIGELHLELQTKLLRLLEDRRVRRLGSVRPVDVDVRIIAATHVDLPAAVRDGRFREDLYYRLSVVPIELPPLRERGDDIVLLAEHFLARFAREYDAPGVMLTAELRRALQAHSWPGNIRELRNALERAVLLGDGGLQSDDLFRTPVPRSSVAGGALPFPAPLEAIERAAARAMLELHGGNKSGAATALGISRSRLYRLLEGGET